jgi:hypothetical protein
VLLLMAVAARCCVLLEGAMPASPSISSGRVIGRFGGGGQGSSSLPLARHGGENGRGFCTCDCCCSDLLLGSSGDSTRRFITAAISPSSLQIERRSLQPLASATVYSDQRLQVFFNLQAAMPLWKPYGYSAVCSRLPVPSGLVPHRR